MSCILGRHPVVNGCDQGHVRSDPAYISHSRHAEQALTSLRAWHTASCVYTRNSRQVVACTAAQNSADARGTVAEALIGGVTQTLAAGVSAASLATGSLARIQRIISPLPLEFPPGTPSPLHVPHPVVSYLCSFIPLVLKGHNINL